MDEDFDLLLEALERAERGLNTRLGATPDGTPDSVLMTGRGDMRGTFEKRLSRRTSIASPSEPPGSGLANTSRSSVWPTPASVSTSRRLASTCR